jgi:glycosyltransferase involved in cell wall biosynthesis
MNNNSPLVSIGLPVYNGERYLEQEIDSVLDQTYPNFELIISDNASNDRTQEICLKYAQKDQRIKYHRNDKNLGGAPNHNLVFRLAKGKYFKWASYDDKIAPDFLSKCVEVLDKNPDVVLCMPKTGWIDEHGQYLRQHKYKADGDLPDPHKRFQNLMLKNETGNYLYGLLRVDSVAKTALHGSYPSADLVFLAELALYGRYYMTPEPLFYRRSHDTQSTKGDLRVERSRSLWFDTSLEGKIVVPKWQMLFGFLKAVKNAPVNMYQRLYCYLQIIRWALEPPHFRALCKDLLLAMVQFIKNGFRMSKKINSPKAA